MSVPAVEREKAFAAAVERMKTSTRQYAKRQVSWLRNKLLPAARAVNAKAREAPGGPGDDVVPTFLLDASGAPRPRIFAAAGRVREVSQWVGDGKRRVGESYGSK